MIPDLLLENPLVLVLAILTAVVGVGRLVRIIAYDSFPPAVAFRIWWSRLTTPKGKAEGAWTKLFTCFWCLAPWVMLVALGWFLLGFAVLWIAWAWWLFWGWLGLSYLVSMLIVRDEPRE